MFRLARPSMAVNDPRVSSGRFMRRFQMWNTWDIQATETRRHILEWVAEVARRASGGKLKNLVLSCHGLPGYLQLGEGFDRSHVELFAAWQGLIEKIWLPDCLVARIPDAAMQAQLNTGYPGFNTSDGNVFCSALAKKVGCYLIAPTETQCEQVTAFPIDHISSFEGLVLAYGPQGDVVWSHRNPSTWIDNSGACERVPD